MTLALILFAITYILMFLLTQYRYIIALVSAVLFVALGILPANDILPAIDFNVILMLAGTMGIVSLFIDSGMPARIADMLLHRVPNACWAIIMLSLFSGVISAFIDNVATVLMVAPIGLAISKKLRISPVPVVIAIAVSSNLQGAATLVGDTTSILLGGYADMDFLDFFFMNGKPGIFWAVELGALGTIPVLLRLFRNDRAPVDKPALSPVQDYFPTFLLCAVVVLLIAASFIPNKPPITNGLICAGLCIIGFIWAIATKNSAAPVVKAITEIDFQTLMLLIGLFVIIAGITEAGVIDAVSELFVHLGSGSIFVTYTLLVIFSVVFSAFIDNIPYVATMLPVVAGIAQLMGIAPHVLYFGLLTGATLGGNLTPIGASANIAGIGILRKEGYEVKTHDFLRIGVPFTLTAVLVGYLFIWIFWRP